MRDPGEPRDPRGRRNPPRPRGRGRLARWGAAQGGLGVCIIVASAAVGAIVTMAARSAPGLELGLFIVVGTVAASLAVRPRAGRMIFPVPVLCYLVAALLSGVVFDRSADSSKAELAINAAQWIANGFFAMVLATVLAVAIIGTRWLLWRRGRPTTRGPGWPDPGPDPAGTGPSRTGASRTGPTRAGTVQPGSGRDGAARPPRAGFQTAAESGHPAGFAGPVHPREIGEADGLGGSGASQVSRGSRGSRDSRGSRGSRDWGDPGSRGTGPRPAPRRGSEPYNFSSGA